MSRVIKIKNTAVGYCDFCFCFCAHSNYPRDDGGVVIEVASFSLQSLRGAFRFLVFSTLEDLLFLTGLCFFLPSCGDLCFIEFFGFDLLLR